MTQDQRDRVMARLRNEVSDLIVATDVAARGLDIDQLTHVVNYDVPSDPDSYTHRIGRVGRAGREGVAITLAEPREHRMLKTIERVTRSKITIEKLPTVADLRARRLEMTRSAIEDLLVEGDLDRFRVVLDTLTDEHDVVEIALAAVKLAHEASGQPDDDEAEIPEVREPRRQDGQREGLAAQHDAAVHRRGPDRRRAAEGPRRRDRGRVRRQRPGDRRRSRSPTASRSSRSPTSTRRRSSPRCATARSRARRPRSAATAPRRRASGADTSPSPGGDADNRGMHPVLPRAAAFGVFAALVAAAPAAADVVVPDDQIVQGSVCAGPDCVNNESFGFDTIRLKGPSLRLAFNDTSSSPGFPTTDWALVANDADGSGSDSYFGFQDTTARTTPLRVLANAPTDTLRVEADGSVRLPTGALLQRVDATTTENAAPVDGAALVTALSTLPLSSYEYTADAANTRHLGPTASAFNSAFGVGSGTDDLAPADEAGVALAATKVLAARVADLTGPQGAKGEPGAPGAKGDTGAKGADASPSDGLAAALKRLKALEKAQKTLRARNAELRKALRKLRGHR